ncbi:MAG TPA: hypothetical protein VLE70_02815 [Anaerolineae bacterium]|jgi:hypothetical protein|nr:hypothetical protein [Anaerolineae bacterium]
MEIYKRTLPVALAIAFGLLTLAGLMFVPAVGDTLVSWAAFLAAVALILGVINLLGVHSRRLADGNLYSGLLVLSMLAVFGLAIADYFGFTDDAVGDVFRLVQAPLEMAMASLLAFFLLFAGVRMLKRQRSVWATLFIITVLILLIASTALPPFLSAIFDPLAEAINGVFVNAGMRGILIGVALGVVTVALRLLTGSERPYDK